MLKQVVIVSYSASEETQFKVIVVNLFYDVIYVLPSSILSVLSRHVNLLYSDCLLVFLMLGLFLKQRFVFNSLSC